MMFFTVYMFRCTWSFSTRMQPGRMVALLLLRPTAASGWTEAGAVWLLNRGLVESLGSPTGCWTHETAGDAMPKRRVELQRSAVWSAGTSSTRRLLVLTFHLMFASPRIVPGASSPLLHLSHRKFVFKKWKWIIPASTKRRVDCSTRRRSFFAATFPPWWLIMASWPLLRTSEAFLSWEWSKLPSCAFCPLRWCLAYSSWVVTFS